MAFRRSYSCFRFQISELQISEVVFSLSYRYLGLPSFRVQTLRSCRCYEASPGKAVAQYRQLCVAKNKAGGVFVKGAGGNCAGFKTVAQFEAARQQQAAQVAASFPGLVVANAKPPGSAGKLWKLLKFVRQVPVQEDHKAEKDAKEDESEGSEQDHEAKKQEASKEEQTTCPEF